MRRRVLLVNEKPYLAVTPVEVQWIADEPIVYTVNTNPKRVWRIA